MENELKETIYSIEKRNNNNFVDDGKMRLTPKDKMFLGAIVFVIMLLFALFAGADIGKDLGIFIYNISH